MPTFVQHVGTAMESSVTQGSHPTFAQFSNSLVQKKKSRSAPLCMYQLQHFE